jgi:hypothetical protein
MAVTTARAMVTAGTPAGAMAARARITAEGSKAPEKHSSAEREDRDPAGSRPFLGKKGSDRQRLQRTAREVKEARGTHQEARVEVKEMLRHVLSQGPGRDEGEQYPRRWRRAGIPGTLR